MSKYSNTSSVPMSLAVFLASDSYDHDPETISATALLKPIRQTILSSRLPADITGPELSQQMANRMGTAIHDGIERAWKGNYQQAMADIGLPAGVIKRVRINPTKEELTDDIIPVYLEQRAYKQIRGYTISGKFDFVGDGRVEDFKTSSVFMATSHKNDKKHSQQGSLYRWLNPAIITQDEMAIQYIFTDWMAARAKTDPKYPPNRFQQRILPLMSLAETEHFVNGKLDLLEKFKDAEEAHLPLCDEEDLWRSEPVFKYYKNPEKTLRSTKNFDTMQEALIHKASIGVGIILEKPGQVMACKYCAAFPLCSQKDVLIAAGDLVL